MVKLNIKILFVSALTFMSMVSCSKYDCTYTEPEATVFTVAPRIFAGYGDIPLTYSYDNEGAANVSATDYRQRYILEVWSEDGGTKEYREVKITGIGDPTPVFSPRLLSGKYKMALWADFVTAQSVGQNSPAGTNLFYDADCLKSITLLRADFSNDAKDAYAASFEADLRESGLHLTVTMKRPLVKVRLVATDSDIVNSSVGLDGCTANLVFSNYSNPCYNVLDRSVVSSGGISSSIDYFPVGDDYGTAYGPSNDNHSRTLAWDYLFVPAAGLTTDITVRLKNGTGGEIILPSADDRSSVSKTIKNVILKPNTLTTVVGRFFSTVTVIEARP